MSWELQPFCQLVDIDTDSTITEWQCAEFLTHCESETVQQRLLGASSWIWRTAEMQLSNKGWGGGHDRAGGVTDRQTNVIDRLLLFIWFVSFWYFRGIECNVTATIAFVWKSLFIVPPTLFPPTGFIIRDPLHEACDSQITLWHSCDRPGMASPSCKEIPLNFLPSGYLPFL